MNLYSPMSHSLNLPFADPNPHEYHNRLRSGTSQHDAWEEYDGDRWAYQNSRLTDELIGLSSQEKVVDERESETERIRSFKTIDSHTNNQYKRDRRDLSPGNFYVNGSFAHDNDIDYEDIEAKRTRSYSYTASDTLRNLSETLSQLNETVFECWIQFEYFENMKRWIDDYKIKHDNLGGKASGYDLDDAIEEVLRRRISEGRTIIHSIKEKLDEKDEVLKAANDCANSCLHSLRKGFQAIRESFRIFKDSMVYEVIDDIKIAQEATKCVQDIIDNKEGPRSPTDVGNRNIQHGSTTSATRKSKHAIDNYIASDSDGFVVYDDYNEDDNRDTDDDEYFVNDKKTPRKRNGKRPNSNKKKNSKKRKGNKNLSNDDRKQTKIHDFSLTAQENEWISNSGENKYHDQPFRMERPSKDKYEYSMKDDEASMSFDELNQGSNMKNAMHPLPLEESQDSRSGHMPSTHMKMLDSRLSMMSHGDDYQELENEMNNMSRNNEASGTSPFRKYPHVGNQMYSGNQRDNGNDAKIDQEQVNSNAHMGNRIGNADSQPHVVKIYGSHQPMKRRYSHSLRNEETKDVVDLSED